MSLIDRIDAARARWNILEHPFYVRWERGELSPQELRRYAGEYGHAVRAIAAAAATATPVSGERHADEEAAHVSLWDEFAAAAGATTQSAPLRETSACVSAWTAADDAVGATAVLYAIEAGQPDVSRTKLDGLVQHYGYTADAPATEYFRVHGTLDHQHAEDGRTALVREARREDEDRLVQLAEDALEANWTLLDGVSK